MFSPEEINDYARFYRQDAAIAGRCLTSGGEGNASLPGPLYHFHQLSFAFWLNNSVRYSLSDERLEKAREDRDVVSVDFSFDPVERDPVSKGSFKIGTILSSELRHRLPPSKCISRMIITVYFRSFNRSKPYLKVNRTTSRALFSLAFAD